MIRTARARGRPMVITPTSLPSPVGGWNARDNIADMPPTDAVILTNFVPTPTACALRFGFSNWATGLSGQVNTVMGYNGTSTNKLLAANGSNIFDITAGGAVGAAVQSGLNSDKWQYATLNNTSGNYLYMVNGADAPRYFDGTTWTLPGLTGPTDITKLIGLTFHQNRMWFIEVSSLTAWYGATSAITGALSAFNLTGVVRKGGYLMAVATWTIDAGSGMDDKIVFITSNGEVIIYAGTNPASASDWSLVGVFEIGTPVGRRCWMKYKGDLWIVTQDGVTPLAQGLQSSRLDPRVNLTDKIQFATSGAITSYGGNFGWELEQFPRENLIFLNVPVAAGYQQQFVMNTINGAWCNFTGWAANCWELWQDTPYFGANGVVCKAWDTIADNGTAIMTEGLQAFSYFGKTGILKRFSMMRPVLRTDGSPSVYGNVNVDFDTSTTSSPLSVVPITTYATWDHAVWDTGLWGPGLAVSALWQGVNAIGYSGAPHLITSSSGMHLEWVSTDLVMERGAVL